MDESSMIIKGLNGSYAEYTPEKGWEIHGTSDFTRYNYSNWIYAIDLDNLDLSFIDTDDDIPVYANDYELGCDGIGYRYIDVGKLTNIIEKLLNNLPEKIENIHDGDTYYLRPDVAIETMINALAKEILTNVDGMDIEVTANSVKDNIVQNPERHPILYISKEDADLMLKNIKFVDGLEGSYAKHIKNVRWIIYGATNISKGAYDGNLAYVINLDKLNKKPLDLDRDIPVYASDDQFVNESGSPATFYYTNAGQLINYVNNLIDKLPKEITIPDEASSDDITYYLKDDFDREQVVNALACDVLDDVAGQNIEEIIDYELNDITENPDCYQMLYTDEASDFSEKELDQIHELTNAHRSVFTRIAYAFSNSNTYGTAFIYAIMRCYIDSMDTQVEDDPDSQLALYWMSDLDDFQHSMLDAITNARNSVINAYLIYLDNLDEIKHYDISDLIDLAEQYLEDFSEVRFVDTPVATSPLNNQQIEELNNYLTMAGFDELSDEEVDSLQSIGVQTEDDETNGIDVDQIHDLATMHKSTFSQIIRRLDGVPNLDKYLRNSINAYIKHLDDQLINNPKAVLAKYNNDLSKLRHKIVHAISHPENVVINLLLYYGSHNASAPTVCADSILDDLDQGPDIYTLHDDQRNIINNYLRQLGYSDKTIY